jgi:hypothetical protein
MEATPWSYENGRSVKAVQGALGHASASTKLDIYR